MMSLYLIYLILIVFLGIPAASLIGCAVTEAALMKNRPQMSWLLPLGVMLASVMLRQKVDGGSDMDALLWSLPAFYGRCAFYGTSAGAVIGAVMRWFSAPKELNPV